MKTWRFAVLAAASLAAALMVSPDAAEAQDAPTLIDAWVGHEPYVLPIYDSKRMFFEFSHELAGDEHPKSESTIAVKDGRSLSSWASGIKGRLYMLWFHEDIDSAETLTFSYDKSKTGRFKLQSTGGVEVENFTFDLSPPAAESSTVRERSLYIHFDKPVRVTPVPAAAAFSVTADGSELDVSAVAIDGSVVTLTLARAVRRRQTVKVAYTRPSSNRLRGAARTWAPSFTDLEVTNETPAGPTVETVEVASTPLLDTNGDNTADTYGPGEEIRVRLTFSEAVEVDTSGGAPSVGIMMDPGYGGFAATYESHTLTAVDFVHTVAEPNISTAGIAVLAHALALNGGTIRAAAGAQADALLSHPGVGHDAGHKVDWRRGVTPPPRPQQTPDDRPPRFGAVSVAPLALVMGEAMAPVVLPAASGGNGALSYGLTSRPAGLAGLSFDPATRRLSGTPGSEGRYVFVYRAEDADSNRGVSDTAELTFVVTVEPPRMALLRTAVTRTLAAVARRTLSSALSNIGARFAASVPGTGLTLAGRRLPFGATGSCSGPPPGHGPGAGTDVCVPAGMRSGGVTAEELLRSSAFTLGPGAGAGPGESAPAAARWALWGRGDLGSFAGRPEPGTHYEGELRTGWLGIDARAGRWVAGLAFSHGRGEADYRVEDAGRGRLETTLSALYPYGRWSFDDGLELRMVLGTGTGEARHVPAEGQRKTGDLSMWMASLRLRRDLPAVAGIELAARADASLARLETAEGPHYIDGLSADAWRGRLGLEASRRFAVGGDRTLTPFVEVAGRRDGGDGLTGAGLELAGGVRYSGPDLKVEARGRWLAAHAEQGVRERGVSVTVRKGPGAHGRGLSLMLAPSWGASTGGADALWGDEMPRPSGGTGGETGALDARLGYGVAAPAGGMLTPFAEARLAGGEGRRLRLGTRFEAPRAALAVELWGERRQNGPQDPDHALGLDLRLRF